MEAKGFRTFTREGMQLGVGQDARVDITLQPGEQTQAITVTEALPLIDTTTATLTGTIDNRTVSEIPLNGRNYINLLTLRPGVVNAPGGGATKQTAMGMRENDNFFLVDGVNNYDWATNQQVINGYALAGDASTILPLYAIQEMNTEQIPKAEFGWKPGVQVNVGLKSGTNTLHGSAYAYGRDGAWDANNFFQPSNEPSPPALLPAIWGYRRWAPEERQNLLVPGLRGTETLLGSDAIDKLPRRRPHRWYEWSECQHGGCLQRSGSHQGECAQRPISRPQAGHY